MFLPPHLASVSHSMVRTLAMLERRLLRKRSTTTFNPSRITGSGAMEINIGRWAPLP